MLKLLIIGADEADFKLRQQLKQHKLPHSLVRGPISVAKKLASSKFDAVLWVANPSFKQLFPDIILELNRFGYPLFFLGVGELSLDQQKLIKPDYYHLNTVDELMHLKAASPPPTVTSTQPATARPDAAAVEYDIGTNLQNELYFRNILRSTSKQKKIAKR